MRKLLSILLAFAVGFTGTWLLPPGGAEAKAEQGAQNEIEIGSADDLAKIGTNAAYPLTGNYKMTTDIDLSGRDFIPIGGTEGNRGGISFSGTFDGNGHVISNLHMESAGTIEKSQQWGLFGIIGSDSVQEKASVKNLVLTGVNIDVDVTASNEAYLSAGALAGAVNKNAVIDNVAVIDGDIRCNRSNNGDVVGAGGLIGEMRPNKDDSLSNNGVTVSNVYVGADIECGSSTNNNYASGIIGRIAYMHPASVTGCVFTGTVRFKGNEGNGVSVGNVNDGEIQNVSNCYYISGQGTIGEKVSESALKAGEPLRGLENWTASQDGFMMPPACADASKIQDAVAWAGISFGFAEGDSISSVTGNFTVPTTITIGGVEENLTWTDKSGGTLAVGTDGTVTVNGAYADKDCALTARTESGKEKTYTFHVKSNARLQINEEYAQVGAPLTVAVTPDPGENITVEYTWSVDGNQKGTGNSYTPVSEDLEKMLTVTAQAKKDGTVVGSYDPVRMYISRLPVVYIDTADGQKINDKKNYKPATMRVQGNAAKNGSTTTLYDGGIQIRGRGNSSWNLSFRKLPYKIKLDTKTDLFGFGNSKHWALLANYTEESLLRNKTSYDLGAQMGIDPHLPSEHVEVILNGEYAGNYQLVGNVRIDTGRVEIYDWEDLAGDVAKEIRKAGGVTKDEQDALEDYLNENMQWITSGVVNYGEKTFTLSDYSTIQIPKRDDGKIDVSGGFLFELDAYYDEVSKFRTTSGQPMMFKSPEFIRPTFGAGEGTTETPDTSKENCPALYEYARRYIQAVEDCVHSDDFSINVEKETAVAENAANFTEDFEGIQHYTDLVDMDSLVAYLVLNEFYWNTETMKKSSFMYKDLGEKLKIGPVWDMDWTSNSLVSSGSDGTGRYNVWMVKEAAQDAQAESWYRYLIGDPYFVLKMYQCFKANRTYMDDIVKKGGIIDTQKEYLREAARANYENQYLDNACLRDFETGVERLRTFLTNRLAWMDVQFKDFETLRSSLGKYAPSSNITVTADTSGETTTKYTANLTGSDAAKVGFYINGKPAGVADVTNKTAELTVSDTYLEPNENLVQVRAMDQNGGLLDKGSVSNYQIFTKTAARPALTGKVQILGSLKAGSMLTADISNTNNTEPSYQWMADGSQIDGATSETYRLTEKEIGKRMTVEVSSGAQTGTLTSEPTETVTELINDHLIIHQVYGGGNNDSTPVSHSFIELYNPTDAAINLEGYSLGYLSGGKNGPAAQEDRLALTSGKSIPSGASYLIRCEAQDPATFTGILKIEDFDQEWESRIIDNKQYKIVLYDGEKPADAVSVNEGVAEGLALLDGTISKQKGIRRKEFADTDNNNEDFVKTEYRGADAAFVAANRPRSLKDGAWGITPAPDDKDQDLADSALLDSADASLTQAAGVDKTKYEEEWLTQLEQAQKTLENAVAAKKKSEIETALSKLRTLLQNPKLKEKKDDNPVKDDNSAKENLPQKGETFPYNKGRYKITKVTASGGSVTYVRPEKKTYKSISVPKQVTYGGLTFKVTEIEKNAMKNNRNLNGVVIGENVTKIGPSAFMGDRKLKNIQIKSKVLKSVGKNALKNVHAKCKIKVPKSKLNSYKKKFKKKGQKSSVKIVK